MILFTFVYFFFFVFQIYKTVVMATSEFIDDATVQIYKAKMTAAWEQYEAVQRAHHDAYVAWQICAMECKYVEAPRSENGEPATTLQQIVYVHPFRQRLEKAEAVMVSMEKSARHAQFQYESERIKISEKFDNDLLEVAKLIEGQDE